MHNPVTFWLERAQAYLMQGKRIKARHALVLACHCASMVQPHRVASIEAALKYFPR